jgi:hypothetical protein
VPYHRIPKAHIHEDLREIEHDGETVVTVTVDNEAFHVFTVKGSRIETRLADLTHEARIGAQAQRAAWDGAA